MIVIHFIWMLSCLLLWKEKKPRTTGHTRSAKREPHTHLIAMIRARFRIGIFWILWDIVCICPNIFDYHSRTGGWCIWKEKFILEYRFHGESSYRDYVVILSEMPTLNSGLAIYSSGNVFNAKIHECARLRDRRKKKCSFMALWLP